MRPDCSRHAGCNAQFTPTDVDFKFSFRSKREEKVTAKGKGDMQTYWLTNKEDEEEAVGATVVPLFAPEPPPEEPLVEISEADAKLERLVEWNKSILCVLLQKIM